MEFKLNREHYHGDGIDRDVNKVHSRSRLSKLKSKIRSLEEAILELANSLDRYKSEYDNEKQKYRSTDKKILAAPMPGIKHDQKYGNLHDANTWDPRLSEIMHIGLGDFVNMYNIIPELFATDHSLAALFGDGTVYAWGGFCADVNPRNSTVKKYTGVANVYASNENFTAVKSSGDVITWGEGTEPPRFKAPRPSELSAGIFKVVTNRGAFAAIMQNGCLVTWGDSAGGGDSSAVELILSVKYDMGVRVDTICPSEFAFAAKLNDGSVVTWGRANSGGDSSGVKEQLTMGVDSLYSTDSAFAAKIIGGGLVTWGDSRYGGSMGKQYQKLQEPIVTIRNTATAFAAMMGDGSVVAWGNPCMGGEMYSPTDLKDVKQVYSNRAAFVAILNSGKVFAWGNTACGGGIDHIRCNLENVQDIYAHKDGTSFLAKTNLGIFAWGQPMRHVEFSETFSALWGEGAIYRVEDIKDVYPIRYGFLILFENGSMLHVPHEEEDIRFIELANANVNQFLASDLAMVVSGKDGGIVTWGDGVNGIEDTRVLRAKIESLKKGYAAIASSRPR